tara:strand:+ start:257 stop:1093 length:837 start_codon:yes stop_codon:yes gene_type:complete
MDRQGFIGGTDAMRIMKGQWVDLYQEKIGLTKTTDLSNVLAVQLGIYTEDFNLNWFVEQYSPGFSMGESKLEKQKVMTFEEGYVPLKGTADALIVQPKRSWIVECKHTNAFNSMEVMIDRYMPQLQFYMYLHRKKYEHLEHMVCDGLFLSVIFGNQSWASKHISYDHAYTLNMLSKITQFWEHVIKVQPPSNRDAETPDISSIAIDRKVKMNMNTDNEWMSDAHDYVETLTSARKNDAAKKRLMSHIPPDVYQMDCDLLSVNITEKRRTIKVKEKANG